VTDLKKDIRLKLLELLYVFSTALEHEKAAARKELDSALDVARDGTGVSRQDLSDYLRRNYYPEYYRMRKRQDFGKM
jgi:hypothetical protein